MRIPKKTFLALSIGLVLMLTVCFSTIVHSDPDSVYVYNILSVVDLGLPDHDIQVTIEVHYCPACNPNDAGNPGCTAFTHGYPGPPPYTSTSYYCGGLVDGRYIAVQLRDGTGTLVGGPTKTICTSTNCPLDTLTSLSFTLTGTGLSAGDYVTAESDIYCSWCGHYYPEPVTIQIEEAAPPPVGGIWVPINKLELLAPWITLASLVAVATLSIVYVKYRTKKQE